MSIAVQDEIDKLRADLVDPDAVAWTDADLLECLNEAVRATCQVRTNAYPITEYIPLVAGTRQSIPAGGLAIFDVFENEVSKRRVTLVDLGLLDETYRFWPAGTTAVDVIHYCTDPRDPKEWRCYPPNSGAGSVYATYGAVPDPMTQSDAIPLSDEYEPALFARAMAAAYRRNTLRQDLGKTQGYMQQWATLVGLQAQSVIATAPRAGKEGG